MFPLWRQQGISVRGVTPEPCAFPKGQNQKQGHQTKITSGLGVTTHRSRVEFSCCLSLSMTGWMPSMRNSYLRWSLKSRLSCKGQLWAQHKMHILRKFTEIRAPQTHPKASLSQSPGAHHASPLTQDGVDEGHDGCLEAHFISVPARALVQVVDQRLPNTRCQLRPRDSPSAAQTAREHTQEQLLTMLPQLVMHHQLLATPAPIWANISPSRYAAALQSCDPSDPAQASFFFFFWLALP